MTDPQPRETRRAFLKKSAAATVMLASVDFAALAAGATKDVSASTKADASGTLPWYRRALRWGQTNINELDPQRYDIAWWRQYWKRTQVQGVLINAGGIVAYYPSKFPLHYRAAGLGDRDLYGELTRAAHEDGLAVFARMDSNRVHENFFRAHPDWMARDANGEPYRDAELYVTCVNSPYYDEYIPSMLREVIERSHPEGFADNNWNGLDQRSICYCDNCQKKFREKTGQPIPRTRNWDDPVYRQWIQWNYERRTEIWDLFNRTTREAGGPHCLWAGMNSGLISYQCLRFRDYRAICERSEIMMIDEQSRVDARGFQHNGEAGKMIHGLLGWDKLVPESMALYQAGRPTFRLSAKSEPEVRLWMLDGFAGGVQPWWHIVGAYAEDRRIYRTVEPILRWHAENQEYLINRKPVATVGLVWSQRNMDFHGRDNAEEIGEFPRRGWTTALVRARISYLLVHADHIARDADQFSVLILPDLAAMSASQVEAVKKFVERGGSLIATGDSSRCNEWGEPQPDFALADLFGAHVISGEPASTDPARRRSRLQTQHTYLQLTPELRARVSGPHAGNEPAVVGERHPALRGFDETDLLPFGGALETLRVDSGAKVLATFVPPFPMFPPEQVLMSEPRADMPGLIVNEAGGRVAFLPADLDRRFCRDNLTDHANLLANLVRWAARDNFPLHVEGAGFMDCHLYQQKNKLILHLVNLTNAGTWRGPVDELIRVGPLSVRMQLPDGVRGNRIQLLVSKASTKAAVKNGWLHFDVPTILDHEVAVIG
ncbi:MAG TPA: beta-galactosidase [Candidatus Limnocylindrales bacterium]|nr:beta-galactosidase [Candidatus Limnocylindrales bacterium]